MKPCTQSGVSPLDLVGGIKVIIGSAITLASNLAGTLRGIVAFVIAELKGAVGNVVQFLQVLAYSVFCIIAEVVKLTALKRVGGGHLVAVIIANIVKIGLHLNEVACAIFKLLANPSDKHLLATLDGLLNNLLCAINDLLIGLVKAFAELLNKVNKAVNQALADIVCIVATLFEVVLCLLTKLSTLLQPVGCVVEGLANVLNVLRDLPRKLTKGSLFSTFKLLEELVKNSMLKCPC